MDLNEFNKQLKHICDETLHDGKVMSHATIPPSVMVITDDDNSYEIDRIEPDLLFGCGCWCGAIIMLKKVK